MADPVGLLLVGCGRISAAHLGALAGLEGEIRLAGVADADQGARHRAAAAHAVPAFADLDEALAMPGVDAVLIASPNALHAAQAAAALAAGKHVLVEKPLALTVEDAELIKRIAEENKRVATVDFVLRYNPLVEMLHEIVKAEIFGKLRRVDLRNYAMQDTVPEGHWFWNPEVSGRILLE
uniref:Gfo/Idh/MocA family protein n=1 Tax=Novosphingobium sp. TaxID=1874826 RepID=UPI002584D28D